MNGTHRFPDVEGGNSSIAAEAPMSLLPLNYHLQPRGVYEFHAPFQPTIYKNTNIWSTYLFLIGGLINPQIKNTYADQIFVFLYIMG